jgi:hypothetical protein
MPASGKPYLNFVIEPDLLKQLDDFRFKNQLPTRAAAIKWILNQKLNPPASLSELVEHAIFKIITFRDDRWQGSWGEWRNEVRAIVPVFSDPDLRDAFKRLAGRGHIWLTKPDSVIGIRDAIEYGGTSGEDGVFFFRNSFNASLTPEGRAEWDKIRSSGPQAVPKG